MIHGAANTGSSLSNLMARDPEQGLVEQAAVSTRKRAAPSLPANSPPPTKQSLSTSKAKSLHTRVESSSGNVELTGTNTAPRTASKQTTLHSGHVGLTSNLTGNHSSKSYRDTRYNWIKLARMPIFCTRRHVSDVFSQLTIVRVFGCLSRNSTSKSSTLPGFVDIYIQFDCVAASILAMKLDGERIYCRDVTISGDSSNESIEVVIIKPEEVEPFEVLWVCGTCFAWSDTHARNISRLQSPLFHQVSIVNDHPLTLAEKWRNLQFLICGDKVDSTQNSKPSEALGIQYIFPLLGSYWDEPGDNKMQEMRKLVHVVTSDFSFKQIIPTFHVNSKTMKDPESVPGFQQQLVKTIPYQKCLQLELGQEIRRSMSPADIQQNIVTKICNALQLPISLFSMVKMDEKSTTPAAAQTTATTTAATGSQKTNTIMDLITVPVDLDSMLCIRDELMSSLTSIHALSTSLNHICVAKKFEENTLPRLETNNANNNNKSIDFMKGVIDNIEEFLDLCSRMQLLLRVIVYSIEQRLQ